MKMLLTNETRRSRSGPRVCSPIGTLVVLAAFLLMVSTSLGQGEKTVEKPEAGQPAVWRDPSWKPPASPQSPQAKPNTPEAQAQAQRLKDLVAEVTDRVRPQSTREELLEAFGRVVERAEGVRKRFPELAAGKEAEEVGEQFKGLIGAVADAKEGQDWSLVCARHCFRRAAEARGADTMEVALYWPDQQGTCVSEYANARTHLRRGLQDEKAGERAAAIEFLIGLTYLREMDIEKGVSVLQAIPHRFPESGYAARALEFCGDAELSAFRYDRAMQFYRDLLRRYPGSIEAGSIGPVVENLSRSGAAEGRFDQLNAFGDRIGERFLKPSGPQMQRAPPSALQK